VSDGDLAVRQALRIHADPTRVIAKLFVPGGHHATTGYQVTDAVTHILALDERDVTDALDELIERFGNRHRDLPSIFDHHAGRVANRIPPGQPLTNNRRKLLGATFTHEYTVEAAAVCNPSLVEAPSQERTTAGSVELVMSVRGIGEGHRSSIGFRSVTVDDLGQVAVTPRGDTAGTGTVSTGPLHAAAFRHWSRRASDVEACDWVLDHLGEVFDHDELDARLLELESQTDTRPQVVETVGHLRRFASRSYRTNFEQSTSIDERVLYPVAPAEHNGIEDARFVRMSDGDEVVYYATYTAYDGIDITQQLLRTTDFRVFECSPLQGSASRNKGMALFPRRISGRYVALARPDGATNAVAFSDDLRYWPDPIPLAQEPRLWNAVQGGNCGSPIETDVGWLVLTHGVGPMRTYSLRACLLDLDDPTRVIGELPRPLLSPQTGERDGYVPNVVYSCGATQHRGHLVIPFGISDASIGFATVPTDTILDELEMR
jgi:predicted GH43/DUF377 family glycosyl hydrolase